MALKTSFLLFLFACLLLVADRVSSIDEIIKAESPYPPKEAPPADAPVNAEAPEKSHHHIPEKQPYHPPHKAPAPDEKYHHHHHTPEKQPHPPKKAQGPEEDHHHHHHYHHPTPPPIKPPTVHSSTPPYEVPTPTKHDGCVPLCEDRCKTHRKKRPCMKACTSCCKKCSNCVPPGTSGNTDKCKNWDYVIYHGEKLECP